MASADEPQKIAFVDTPPALRKLVDDMIQRVEDQFGRQAVEQHGRLIAQFRRGECSLTSDEISSGLNALLRLLT